MPSTGALNDVAAFDYKRSEHDMTDFSEKEVTPVIELILRDVRFLSLLKGSQQRGYTDAVENKVSCAVIVEGR